MSKESALDQMLRLSGVKNRDLTPMVSAKPVEQELGFDKLTYNKGTDAAEFRRLSGVRTAPAAPPAPEEKTEAKLNEDVADVIAQQMGGVGKLKVMLGAKVMKSGDTLVIKWPNKERSKGNLCEIKLEGDDTYTMSFFNASGANKKLVKEYTGIYADQLKKTFESQTGWYLSMGGPKGEEIELPGVVEMSLQDKIDGQKKEVQALAKEIDALKDSDPSKVTAKEKRLKELTHKLLTIMNLL